MRDEFTWDLAEPVGQINQFAERLCADVELPSYARAHVAAKILKVGGGLAEEEDYALSRHVREPQSSGVHFR